MGNGVAKLTVCFTGDAHRRHDLPVLISDPLDEGLGHSFCYVKPDSIPFSLADETTTTSNNFRISGASVSANTSTPLSTAFIDPYVYNSVDRAAAFESSNSFASIPLQPIPRNLINSGPLSGNPVPFSGNIERGFMSGPIERGFMSGPLEKGGSDQFQRSFSHGGFAFKRRSMKKSFIRVLQRAISKTVSRGQNSIVAPIKGIVKEHEWYFNSNSNIEKHYNENMTVNGSFNMSSDVSLEDDECMLLESQNLQWAQGKAGEDRMHVVVSEENGWVFVGIYDGFNGPDATDYLLSNLYSSVHKELKGLLWDDEKCESVKVSAPASSPVLVDADMNFELKCNENEGIECNRASRLGQESYPLTNKEPSLRRKRGKKYRGEAKRWEEYQMRWKCEWDRERMELDKKIKEQLNQSGSNIHHKDVLDALSTALKKTEEAYLEIADKMLLENPELALMGSCVLVMLMKGEDVYMMNVGDSRAVIAQTKEPDYGLGKVRQDLDRIREETLYDLEVFDGERPDSIPSLNAFQLSIDHSTSIEEEVQRIQQEHPDDPGAIINDRVKGSLKVTRAFGAGFLKQPKWNNALLKMFRIDYVGSLPYITCLPSLYHHRLSHKDKFLILSSDGVYQYLTNEEAVYEVELFISLQPEGDPAQHLVEEVLFRAAKKAGMDFHELLEIPQGDRRKYHDDISIIVISLEGRIWRSCV